MSPAAADGMSYKILIVEDSQSSREFIVSTVESVNGVEAFTTATGFEALKLLSRQRFDLIITDINMPGINGLELINFVKKSPTYRETPLFVISTEGREQDRAKGLALGAAEYLVKPFEPRQLEGLLFMGSNCGGAVMANPGDTSIMLSGGTLAAGASCSFSVNVVASTTGMKNNSSNAVTSDQGNGNQAMATLSVLFPPSLSVSKTHTGTFVQGSTGEWDVTVSNGAGSVATTGTTTMSDTLPTGYTVNGFSTTAASWSCAGIGTGTATCTSTLGVAGGSSFPVIRIIVNIPANSPTSVTNTAKAFGGGDTTHTNLASAAMGSDTVAVMQVPASVTATGGTPQSTPITTPFPAKLQATVRDAGGVGVPNVSVTFQAPNSGPSGTFGAPCSGTTCIVMADAMGVATAPTFTANGIPGSYTVTATVGMLRPANFLLTNLPPGPPSLTKAFGTSSIFVGGSTTLTFTITNPNVIPLTGIMFTDMLPAGLVVSTPAGVSGTCGGTVTAAAGSNNISLAGGTLAAGASCTISVNVTATAVGTLVNITGPISAAVAGAGITATATLMVTTASLDIPFQTKIFPNLPAGDSLINIGNTGASATIGVATAVAGAPFIIGGNLCVNVYVFSPDEQEVACCTCFITPNGVVTTSARQLISKTLTPAVPSAVTVKLVASDGTGGAASCNAAAPVGIMPGLIAFGTNLHAAPVGGSNTAGTFAVTETPFLPSTLSAAELARINTLCGFIQSNGTGFGVCPGCATGAAGASRQ